MKKLSLVVAAGALAVSLPLAAVEVSTVDELVAALESMNPTATASDEIVLAAGTYNLTGVAQKYYDGGWKDSDSHLAVKALTLRGATEDADDVVLQGDGTTRVLHAVGGTIAHLTIAGGSSAGFGGGVYCKDNTSTFTNVTVRNCSYTTTSGDSGGGGAYRGTWRGCRFLNNSSASCGGAMYSGLSYGCKFTGNTATRRAGAIVYSTSYDSTFENNISSSTGGVGYQTTLSNCIVRACSGSHGGALAYATGAKAAMDCTIENCTASTAGGAGYEVDFIRCTIIRCSSKEGGGSLGGKMYDCNVISNSATTYGGGGKGCIAVSNCLISCNSASSQGGGLYGCTGVFDCTVFSNTVSSALEGSAMRNCYATNCWVACNKGCACVNGYYADCTIVSNTAAGGAAAGYANSRSLIFSNCVAFANAATGSSPIGAFSGATLYDCIVHDNGYVTYGGATRSCTVYGGAIYGNSAYYGGAGYESTFYDVVISNNHAVTLGGVGYSCKAYRCRLVHNYVGDNSKDTSNENLQGGALRYGVAVDCIIEGNAIINSPAKSRLGGGTSDTIMTNCVVRNNYVYGGNGGGISGGVAYGCVISNNVGGLALWGGGGALSCYNSDIYACSLAPCGPMVNCRIMGHPLTNEFRVGDNVYTSGCFAANNIMIQRQISCTNCLFAENTLPSGTSMINFEANKTIQFVNCTFANNRVSNMFWGFSAENKSATAINCIFDENYTPGGTRRDFSFSGGNYIKLVNCLVGSSRTSGSLYYPEENTLTSDYPRFDSANAAHPYSLKRSSPARRRGLVLDWMADATDLRHDEAFPRLDKEGLVDIGCYQCWLEPVGICLTIR